MREEPYNYRSGPEGGFPRAGDDIRQLHYRHRPVHQTASKVHRQTRSRGWRWHFQAQRHLTLKLDMPVLARTASSILKLLSASISPAHSPTTEIFLHLRTCAKRPDGQRQRQRIVDFREIPAIKAFRHRVKGRELVNIFGSQHPSVPRSPFKCCRCNLLFTTLLMSSRNGPSYVRKNTLRFRHMARSTSSTVYGVVQST